MATKPRSEDEKTLVIGLLHLTDALEHAMHALILARPPEDDTDKIKQGKHLVLMTAGVEAAKNASGDLLDEESRKLADEAVERDRQS